MPHDSDLPMSNGSFERSLRDLKNEIREEIDKRPTKEWVELLVTKARSEIREAKTSLDDTKKIALTAQERAGVHDCTQAELIGKIMREVSGWTKWFRVVLISALIGVISVGGTALWKFLTLTTSVSAASASVDDAKRSVMRLESSMVRVEENQAEMRKALEKSAGNTDDETKKQIDEMKDLLKDVLRDRRNR